MRISTLLISFLVLISFKTPETTFNENKKSPAFETRHSIVWADSIISKLSTEQKISQLFMVAGNGKNLGEDYFKKVDTLINRFNIGGLIFFKSSPSDLRSLIKRYNNLSKIPLLTGIDAEWGVSMRIDSSQTFPWAMTIGAIQNDSLIYEMGRSVANQLNSLGVGINFAPVLDINNNPDNPIIDRRSYGQNKHLVSKKGMLFMSSMQENGILACAKHFPGHGDTNVDSHISLPVIRHSYERLDSLELFPFKELIDHNLSSVMTAHISLPSIDSSNVPSSLSKTIIKNILRDSLNFDGLVISDALNMKALSNFSKPGEKELNAFLAGNDILLFPSHVEAAIDLIKKSVIKNKALEDQLNESCRRILMAKAWVQKKNTDIKSNDFKLLNSGDLQLNRDLSKNAITVLKNDGSLPIKTFTKSKIAFLKMGSDSGNIFYNRLNNYLPVDSYDFNKYNFSKENNLHKKLENYDLVIIGLHFPNENFWDSHKLKKIEKDFIENLSQKKDVILNVFGHPRLLNKLHTKNVNSIIVSYQNSFDFQDLTAQLIFGSIGAKGQLPISLNEFPCNSGINLEKTTITEFALPTEVGMSLDTLKKIDSVVNTAIRDKVLPGCQIVVSRYGKIIYNKSFGFHTYDTLKAVKDYHLYDIASLTKILSAAPIVMYLKEKRSINLNKKLKSYDKIFKVSNKANLRIINIFAHQAGLFPWIPFYKNTINDSGNYKENIFSKNEKHNFNIKVARDLYINNSYKDSIFKTVLKSDLLDEKKYKYSDLGFYLIQGIIEKKIESNIQDFISSRLYHPLGLHRILYNPLEKFPKQIIVPTENDNYFRKQLVQGYVHDQGAAMLGGVALHAGLFSNAIDVIRIMNYYLDVNHIEEFFVSQKTINYFSSSHFTENENRRGIIFDKPSIDPDENGPTCDSISNLSFGHSGWTGTMAWSDPDKNISYVFLSNGRSFPDGMNKKLIDQNIRTDIQKIIYNSIIE